MPFIGSVHSGVSYGHGKIINAVISFPALTGVVTTLAGNGTATFADGTGTNASFYNPWGVAVIPSSGVIVVADWLNNRIRLVNPTTAAVTTLAGSGSSGSTDGTGTNATFNQPIGVAVIPSSGVIVVAERMGHRIRLITPSGVVTTLAGSGTGTFADGTGTNASFNNPWGVAVNPSGNTIIVADNSNHCIRLVTYPGGVVTTLAGSGTGAFVDGTGTGASFNQPRGVDVISSSGVIVVADTGNNRVRLVTSSGVVTTLAGNSGYIPTNGTGTNASFWNPMGVAVRGGDVIVSDYQGELIRVINLTTTVVTTLAGSGTAAFADGTGTSAQFYWPTGVAVNPSSGVIIVGDNSNCRIRLIS